MKKFIGLNSTQKLIDITLTEIKISFEISEIALRQVLTALSLFSDLPNSTFIDSRKLQVLFRQKKELNHIRFRSCVSMLT
jgi:hypothetical protein